MICHVALSGDKFALCQGEKRDNLIRALNRKSQHTPILPHTKHVILHSSSQATRKIISRPCYQNIHEHALKPICIYTCFLRDNRTFKHDCLPTFFCEQKTLFKK